jgi:hypothetical protein
MNTDLTLALIFLTFIIINGISNAIIFRRVVREEIPDQVFSALEAYDIEMSEFMEEQQKEIEIETESKNI